MGFRHPLFWCLALGWLVSTPTNVAGIGSCLLPLNRVQIFCYACQVGSSVSNAFL
jgi:hypothetical protein